MAVFGGPEILNSGLVLALDAGNTRSYPGSGNTWTDISGNGNAGTFTNGPTFSSGSIVLDGVDDHIPISSYVNPKTIIAWVKISTAAGGDYIVYGTDSNGQDNWFGVNGSKVYFFGTQSADTNNFSISGTTTLNTTNFYQIACTIDGATAKVYCNGVEENSTTRAFTIGSWDWGTPTLGRRGSIAQRYFPGNIAIINVYDTVITPAQIQQNFNALRGRFGV